MVEGEQGSVLLKAVLNFHRLQQNRDQLGPLPRTVQACHFSNQHCYLCGDLQYKSYISRTHTAADFTAGCEYINIHLNVK